MARAIALIGLVVLLAIPAHAQVPNSQQDINRDIFLHGTNPDRIQQQAPGHRIPTYDAPSYNTPTVDAPSRQNIPTYDAGFPGLKRVY